MKKTLYLTLLAALVSSGCARNISPSTYSAASIGEAQVTYRGVIEKAEIVEVEDKEYLGDNTTGIVGGGLGGGAAGYALTGGSSLGTTIGALAGGVGGAFLEKELKRQQAMLYTVKLQTGGLMSITQGLDPKFAPGQKVRVIMGQGKNRTRVLADS